MSRLLKNCPFKTAVTSSGSVSTCSFEVSPYKNLGEVMGFLNLLGPGYLHPWFEDVHDLEPSTDYCCPYQSGDVVTDVWYPKQRLERNSVPKTLICHDYKGGYLEDRFINGSPKHNSYNFCNWSYIDIFVYFSHHFVTVPPPSWINAAHVNGVPILGTLITEWVDGKRIWDEVLQSEEKATWLADVLSLMASIHKFDGYLINIENILDPDQIPMLMTFLKRLKDTLRTQKSTKTYVIWYDSVTILGELKWQNELNALNKPFFDITDGIFLNYTWKEENLENSRQLAGERLYDVFVGVDVFGRNCFGGGGFNTKSAMNEIRKKSMSAAIFAFAWTKETLPGDFRINDNIFWYELLPYFYMHGLKKIPFKTDFNQGYGNSVYEEGQIKTTQSWYNLSKQNCQPLFVRYPNPNNDSVMRLIVSLHDDIKSVKEQYAAVEKPSSNKVDPLLGRLEAACSRMQAAAVEFVTSDSFSGGGCLKITPSLHVGGKYITLFLCDMRVKHDWILKAIVKTNDSQDVYPHLYVVIETEDHTLVKKELKDTQLNETRIGPSRDFASGLTWVARRYFLNESGRIIELGLVVSQFHNDMYLGELSIEPW